MTSVVCTLFEQPASARRARGGGESCAVVLRVVGGQIEESCCLVGSTTK